MIMMFLLASVYLLMISGLRSREVIKAPTYECTPRGGDGDYLSDDLYYCSRTWSYHGWLIWSVYAIITILLFLLRMWGVYKVTSIVIRVIYKSCNTKIVIKNDQRRNSHSSSTGNEESGSVTLKVPASYESIMFLNKLTRCCRSGKSLEFVKFVEFAFSEDCFKAIFRLCERRNEGGGKQLRQSRNDGNREQLRKSSDEGDRELLRQSSNEGDGGQLRESSNEGDGEQLRQSSNDGDGGQLRESSNEGDIEQLTDMVECIVDSGPLYLKYLAEKKEWKSIVSFLNSRKRPEERTGCFLKKVLLSFRNGWNQEKIELVETLKKDVLENMPESKENLLHLALHRENGKYEFKITAAEMLLKANLDKTVRQPDDSSVEKWAEDFVEKEYRNDGGYPTFIRDQLLELIQSKTASNGQTQESDGVGQAANDPQNRV